MNIIKIFGAPRSGTTYTQWLISNNFHNVAVLISILGGKHGFPREWNIDQVLEEVKKYGLILSWWCSPNFKDDFNRNYEKYINEALKSSAVKYVLCFKNPYSWLVSQMKFRPNQDPKKLLSHWNKINIAWLNFYDDHEQSCFIVRYEDLFEDFAKVLGGLKKRFNLIQSNDNFVNSNRSFAPKNIKDKYNREYYEKKEFLNEIEDFDLFRKNLSVNLMKRLNYRVL